MNKAGYWRLLNNKKYHLHILRIALPLVLANLSIPIVGIIDSAVVGHLGHAWYLAGVSLGNTVISVVFFILGFLRMATTGLIAQAHGEGNKLRQATTVLQGLLCAVVISITLFICYPTIGHWLFALSDASSHVKHYAELYINIRIYALPAVLSNMVFVGWFLGNQDAIKPMVMLLLINTINILLDGFFVIILHLNVEGVAIASNIADYSGLFFASICAYRMWHRLALGSLRKIAPLLLSNIGQLLHINKDLFLRSLCLQCVFLSLVFLGANLGDDIAAANAILINFILLNAYIMDGLAYATEALVGRCVGRSAIKTLRHVLLITLLWSLIIAIVLTCLFLMLGNYLISLMTDINPVQIQAEHYFLWLLVFPLVSFGCFLLDGIFIGASLTIEMRNTMLFSCAVFFLGFFTLSQYNNHALWAMIMVFHATRSFSMAYVFMRSWKSGAFVKQQQANLSS